MSRMQCKCGAEMGTSDCPSPYNLAIYYESEIIQAITYNPKLTLNDFLTGWDELKQGEFDYMSRNEPVDYWYCTECMRVYEVQQKIGGHWLRVYKRQIGVHKSYDISNYKKIYIFSEIETDAATERDINILLSNYLKNNGTVQYFLSQDERSLVALDTDSGNLVFTYLLEED